MSKDWDYAKLVEDVSKKGGVDKWINAIKTNSYKKGAADMKNSLVVPLLAAGVGIGIAGVLATQKVIEWVRENKEKKVITETEAMQAEKFLLNELEETMQEVELEGQNGTTNYIN